MLLLSWPAATATGSVTAATSAASGSETTATSLLFRHGLLLHMLPWGLLLHRLLFNWCLLLHRLLFNRCLLMHGLLFDGRLLLHGLLLYRSLLLHGLLFYRRLLLLSALHFAGIVPIPEAIRFLRLHVLLLKVLLIACRTVIVTLPSWCIILIHHLLLAIKTGFAMAPHHL